MLPALELRHDVLAPTLPGHAGGPRVPDGGLPAVVDALERMLDEAGFASARLVGNSLGGYLALALAERGRADSLVALAPAGGWRDRSLLVDTLERQRDAHAALRLAAPHVDAIVATPEGRRRATSLVAERSEHIPPELVVHQTLAAARCDADGMLDAAGREPWPLSPGRIACPVRIVWGTADRLLPWPDAAERFRDDDMPPVEWAVLDGVGHCPQLDLPLETVQLVLAPF